MSDLSATVDISEYDRLKTYLGEVLIESSETGERIDRMEVHWGAAERERDEARAALAAMIVERDGLKFLLLRALVKCDYYRRELNGCFPDLANYHDGVADMMADISSAPASTPTPEGKSGRDLTC